PLARTRWNDPADVWNEVAHVRSTRGGWTALSFHSRGWAGRLVPRAWGGGGAGPRVVGPGTGGRMGGVSPALPEGEVPPAGGSRPASVVDGAEGRDLGVYPHVPFCTVRCGYCDFNTYTAAELGGGASQASY